MSVTMASSKKAQTLCLNMIVKNESHIIANNLEKLTQKLKFDYWVISDTGSTDNTVALIIDFFKRKGIPGEIHQDEWKGFGYNRTLALAHAFMKTDYLLIFDADDEISGNINLPINDLTLDSYRLVFGNSHTFSYERPLIVNNHKKWRFVGVLHEYLDTLVEGDSHTTAVILGDYSVVSGRTGNRSADPDKYLKDAKVLEIAYAEEVATDGKLGDRYAFYCGNSFFDCGRFEDAVKWYKIVLSRKGWDQEKYISCLKLYKCYKRLQNVETGHFYLVKSHYYDKERVECLYKLIMHYTCEGQPAIAYSYYSLIQRYYETEYITKDYTSKLFVDNRVANFFLPYYMIIVADGIKNKNLGIKMFEIIFNKKTEGITHWHLGNIMHNLRLFIPHVEAVDKIAPGYSANFFKLCNEYFVFLKTRGYNLEQHDYMKTFAVYDIPCLKHLAVPLVPVKNFTDEECASSMNVLVFAGFGGTSWNYTYGMTDALGGSERAAAFLSYNFPKKYNIFVAGDVKEEKFSNITYVNMQNLTSLINSNCFHTVIISRYISFLEIFPNYRAFQTFLWTHDTTYHNYGCSLERADILSKHYSKITGVICLTNWHRMHISSVFPSLMDKIKIINNGISPNLFPNNRINDHPIKKIKNQFIYSSCSERGLKRLLQLWPGILEMAPDATLRISSYNRFPRDEEEKNMWEIIKQHESIKHVGKLNPSQLYALMASSEYWLYPSYWPETSCITALEMLQSKVICLYYPVAGIVETMGGYGFPIKENEELNELSRVLNLPKEEKEIVILKGKEYSDNCSWEKRAETWALMLFSTSQIGKTDASY
jgi:glycosyltransferase involved in cell wall biosynthesis